MAVRGDRTLAEFAQMMHKFRVGNSFGELPDPDHSERVRFTMATDSNTREIPLTQGKVALVDAADYETLARFKWYAFAVKGTYRVARMESTGTGKRRQIYMHRQILGEPEGMCVDHANRNSLDHRRVNLRVCTTRENNRNVSPRNGSSSKYLGVSWNKDKRAWTAQIMVDGMSKYIGKFASEDDAARAYDAAARSHHGEYANPNFKD